LANKYGKKKEQQPMKIKMREIEKVKKVSKRADYNNFPHKKFLKRKTYFLLGIKYI
jgi:hypothetical protein